jgi:hypothetical protein
MARSIIRTRRAATKPRKTASETFLINKKYLGDEPEFKSKTVISSSEQTRAYNWYNVMCDVDEAREYLEEYLTLKNRKNDLKAVKRVPNNYLPLTICWIARMLSRGAILPEKSIEFFENKFDHVINLSIEREEPDDKKANVEKVTIQDRIKEKISNMIAEIEGYVDARDESFDMYAFLQSNEFPAKYASSISKFYEPIAEEIELAVQGKVEGYTNYSKKELKSLHSSYKKLVEDANRYGSVQKKVRKTRAKKTQSIDKKLKFFKYKVEDQQLRLASIKPEDIIGAQELWCYNIQNKTLSVYRALDRAGLDIKRSSITKYDEKTSVSKRIGRKTEEVIDKVLKGGKIAQRKLMDELTSAATETNGRINPNTILLRVIKL